MEIHHPVTGEVLVREPVDCREICEILGYVFSPVEGSAPQALVAMAAGSTVESRSKAEAMSVTDLREALTEKKVSIPNGAKKDDLVELFMKN